MPSKYLSHSSLLLALLFWSSIGLGATLKTFILAQETTDDFNTTVAQTKTKLSDAGFNIAGKYSPYKDTVILIVSNDTLTSNAAASEFGGFGAAQRISITKVKDKVQLAFTNPVYMAHAYRMKSDLADVSTSLKKTLGFVKEYGPEDGLEADDLRDYHYKWLMPYFTDRIKLASFANYEQAVQKVQATLNSNNKGAARQVYKIDIPGKQETVIGVALAGDSNYECSGDKYIMERIDFKDIRSSAHLPYEVLISGKSVYTLPAEFRIAISFPDLSMIGSNSFASIMCAPEAISSALTHGVGGSLEKDDF